MGGGGRGGGRIGWRKRRNGKEKRPRDPIGDSVKGLYASWWGEAEKRREEDEDGEERCVREGERVRVRERSAAPRGTVERYLCDCLSSGCPLFCYNHVSVRFTRVRTSACVRAPGCKPRNLGLGSSGRRSGPRRKVRTRRVPALAARRYHCVPATEMIS